MATSDKNSPRSEWSAPYDTYMTGDLDLQDELNHGGLGEIPEFEDVVGKGESVGLSQQDGAEADGSASMQREAEAREPEAEPSRTSEDEVSDDVDNDAAPEKDVESEKAEYTPLGAGEVAEPAAQENGAGQVAQESLQEDAVEDLTRSMEVVGASDDPKGNEPNDSATADTEADMSLPGDVDAEAAGENVLEKEQDHESEEALDIEATGEPKDAVEESTNSVDDDPQNDVQSKATATKVEHGVSALAAQSTLTTDQLIALIKAITDKQGASMIASSSPVSPGAESNAGEHLAAGGLSVLDGTAALIGGAAATVGAVGKGIGAPFVKLGQKISGAHDSQSPNSLQVGGEALKEGAISLMGGTASLIGGAGKLAGGSMSWANTTLRNIVQRMAASRNAKMQMAQQTPGVAPAQTLGVNANVGGSANTLAGQAQAGTATPGSAPSSAASNASATSNASQQPRGVAAAGPAAAAAGGGPGPVNATTFTSSASGGIAAGQQQAPAAGASTVNVSAAQNIANAAAYRARYESLQAANVAATAGLQQKISKRGQDLGLTSEEIIAEMRDGRKAEDLMGEFSEQVNADAELRLRRQMMNDAMAGAVAEFNGIKGAAWAQDDQGAFTDLKEEWMNWKKATAGVMPTRDDAMTDADRVEDTLESAPDGYNGKNVKSYEAVRDTKFAEIDYERSIERMMAATDEPSRDRARKEADVALDGWINSHEKALHSIDEDFAQNGDSAELSALASMNEQTSKKMSELAENMPAQENEASHAERIRQLLEKLKEIINAIKRLFGKDDATKDVEAKHQPNLF